MSDTEVIELIRRGRDQQAFSKLYAHFPKVDRMVKANSGSRSDAKDIFQDALIIFHRKAREADFTLTAAISTFLYGICRNLWRDELRRRNKAITKWDMEDSAEEPADLSALLAREGEYGTAEKALKGLGEKCLDVLQRFYVAHQSLQEIAKALGFAGEGAAKTRKYKCLEAARKRYRDLIGGTRASIQTT
jgi:RNA polymerase sigma factor (sigma-70 family)